MEEDKKVGLGEAVDMASQTHNTNVMVSGFTPMIFPGISQGNVATESMYQDDGVRTIMERHNEVGRQYREQEFEEKFEKAANLRMRGYEEQRPQRGQ